MGHSLLGGIFNPVLVRPMVSRITAWHRVYPSPRYLLPAVCPVPLEYRPEAQPTHSFNARRQHSCDQHKHTGHGCSSSGGDTTEDGIGFDENPTWSTSYTHRRGSQAFRQTIGEFVYHDLRKSNDVIILVQGRWSQVRHYYSLKPSSER